MYTGIQGPTYTYPAATPEPVSDLFRRVMFVITHVVNEHDGFGPSHLIVQYQKQAYRLDIEAPPVKAKEHHE